MSSADLTFDITARDNASAAVGKVAAALQRMDRTASTADKTHRSLGTTTGRVASGLRTMVGVLGGVATGYAAIKIAQFGKDSIRAASDLQEATSATGVMFGKQKQAIVEWADTAAQAFGQSRTQAMQSATYFGTLGKAAGLTGREVAGFSKQMVVIGSDLASFFNTSPAEAMEALGAGLRGESEPLRRYGVLLDDATLKARALKMGIYSGTGTLTQQQRVLAAHAEILNQTNKAQGDFARTQQGWANQTRVFSAQLENLKATAGKALLPIATDYIQRINRAMPEMEKSINRVAPDIGRSLVGIADSVADNWPEIKEMFGSVADAAKRVGGVLKTVWDGFRSLPPGIQDAALQLGAIAAAMKIISKTGIGSALSGGFSLGKSVLGGGGVSSTRAMTINAGVVNVNGKVVGGPGGGGPGGAAGGKPAWGLPLAAGFSAALSTAVVSAIGVAIPTLVASIGNSLQRNFPGLNNTPSGRPPITGGTPDGPGGNFDNPVPGRFGRLTPSDTRQTEQHAAALRDVATAAGLGTSRTRMLAVAVGSYRNSASQAARAAKSSEAGIQGNSRAAQRNKSALSEQAVAARGVLSSMRNMGATTRAVTRTQAQLGREFVKTARDMGVPKQQARDLARSFGLIPKRKSTRVDAPGAKDARRDVDNHTRSANRVPGRKGTRVDAPGAKGSRRDIDAVTSAAAKVPRNTTANVDANTSSAISGIGGVANALADIDGSEANTYINVIKRNIGGSVNVDGNAEGGHIRGPGTSTSDSILAALSDGEFVTRTWAVNRIGLDRMEWINRTGTLPTFAKGGQAKKGKTATSTRGQAKKGKTATSTRAASVAAASEFTEAETKEINDAVTKAVTAHLAETKSRKRKPSERYAKGDSDNTKRAKDRAYEKRISAKDARQELASITNQARRAATDRVKTRKANQAQRDQDAQQRYFAELERQEQIKTDAANAAAQYRESALSEYQQFRDQAMSGIGSGLSSAKSFASTTGFDLNAAAQAEEELRLARGAVNTANTPAERAQALAAVADAQAKANAAAVTPANVVANFRNKIAKVREFKDALVGLRDRGLNPTTLSEIAQMDPESGLTLAKAISGSNLAEINGLQSQLLTVGAEYGAIAHNANMGADQAATAVMDSVIGRGGIATTVNVSSQLFLDGKQVYESLKAIERQMGGPLWRT